MPKKKTTNGQFKKGHKHSLKIRKKISEAIKKRWAIQGHPKGALGKHWKHSPKTIERMRKASKGRNKGRKHSEETKQKMREAHLGKKNAFYGKNHNEKSKNLMSKNNVSKRPEYRKKISERMKLRTGIKSHFWKGGITPKNLLIRSTAKFKEWRTAVFERDGYACQMLDCDKIEKYLNAHHIKKFSDYPELRFAIDNGITLCKKCHNKTKKREEKFVKMFNKIICKNE